MFILVCIALSFCLDVRFVRIRLGVFRTDDFKWIFVNTFWIDRFPLLFWYSSTRFFFKIWMWKNTDYGLPWLYYGLLWLYYGLPWLCARLPSICPKSTLAIFETTSGHIRDYFWSYSGLSLVIFPATPGEIPDNLLAINQTTKRGQGAVVDPIIL